MNRYKVTESKSPAEMAQQLFEKYSKELKEFEEWIASKPHYPQNMGKNHSEDLDRVLLDVNAKHVLGVFVLTLMVSVCCSIFQINSCCFDF